jgi:nucleoid-associated protein YgaU
MKQRRFPSSLQNQNQTLEVYMKGMYQYAVDVAKDKFHGTIEDANGKVVFKGTVATDADKNAIWNAIKTIPTWQHDVEADIRVTGGASAAAKKTYTVKSGDTLSGIAKSAYGNANDYVKIFELNRDQLSDPDKIKPGQILKLE